jgi:hypothetical protein
MLLSGWLKNVAIFSKGYALDIYILQALGEII